MGVGEPMGPAIRRVVVDLAKERAASLARQAERDGPVLLAKRARRVLELHWNASESVLRERIAEKFPALEPAEAAQLLDVCVRLQREDRPKVKVEVQWKPDWHLNPLNRREGQNVAGPYWNRGRKRKKGAP